MHLLTSVPLPLHPTPHTYTRGARNDPDMDDDSSAGNNSRRQPSAVSSLKAVRLRWSHWQTMEDSRLRSVRNVAREKSAAIEIVPVLIAELRI